MTAAVVDCMACLVTGVLASVGFRDECGIMHHVRWSTHKGPYKLCDFIKSQNGTYIKVRKDARRIGTQITDELIWLEEP